MRFLTVVSFFLLTGCATDLTYDCGQYVGEPFWTRVEPSAETEQLLLEAAVKFRKSRSIHRATLHTGLFWFEGDSETYLMCVPFSDWKEKPDRPAGCFSERLIIGKEENVFVVLSDQSILCT